MLSMEINKTKPSKIKLLNSLINHINHNIAVGLPYEIVTDSCIGANYLKSLNLEK